MELKGFNDLFNVLSRKKKISFNLKHVKSHVATLKLGLNGKTIIEKGK